MSAGRDDDLNGAPDAPGDEPIVDPPTTDRTPPEPDPPTPVTGTDDNGLPAPTAATLHNAPDETVDADAGAAAPPGNASIFAEPISQSAADTRPTDDGQRPADASQQSGPLLPESQAKPPPPMVDPLARPRPGASTWYRTDEDRNRSVYRRANPWYRRVARAVIGLCFLGAAGIGIYVGARALQDYLDRDRLPAVGADVPDFRQTTLLISSEAPAPELDGTLTLDIESGAFEFVGRAAGPQSGLQVVSADGEAVYVRRGTDMWRAAAANDPDAGVVRTALAYLADDNSADDILTNGVRRDYVDLIARVDEGVGDNVLTRYDMEMDTRDFAAAYPLQWDDFKQSAIPNAVESTALPVTIWLDRDNVLVRVRDTETNWAWERLTYSDQRFVVEPPAGDVQVTQVACVADDVFWQSPMSSCDGAYDIGRQLAVTAGVTEQADDPAIERVIAELCLAMERDDGPLTETAERIALAAALVEQGVCVGDPDVFVADG